MRPFGPGDRIPGNDFWEEVVATINSRQIQAEEPLSAKSDAAGTVLEYKPGLTMNGIVTAATGYAYFFVEAWFQGVAFVPMPGGRVVMGYPYNPSDSLEIGAPASLRYTRAGDWRFEVIRDGAAGQSTPPPPPTACNIQQQLIPSVYTTGNNLPPGQIAVGPIAFFHVYDQDGTEIGSGSNGAFFMPAQDCRKQKFFTITVHTIMEIFDSINGNFIRDVTADLTITHDCVCPILVVNFCLSPDFSTLSVCAF